MQLLHDINQMSMCHTCLKFIMFMQKSFQLSIKFFITTISLTLFTTPRPQSPFPSGFSSPAPRVIKRGN